MRRFFFPLVLIALGVLGFTEQDAINSEWDAIYPEDPVERNALDRCAREESAFNRLSAVGRAECYQKYLQLPVAAPITVGIPGSPTHVTPHPGPVRNNSNQR